MRSLHQETVTQTFFKNDNPYKDKHFTLLSSAHTCMCVAALTTGDVRWYFPLHFHLVLSFH